MLSANDLDKRRLASHGLSVQIDIKKNTRATLTLISNGAPYWRPITIELASPLQTVPTMRDALLVWHYPGKTRHPGGTEATTSWFNDAGEGWLRLITGGTICILPLVGWETDRNNAAIPEPRTTGPARAHDLWLAVAALLDPLHITAKRLHQATHINAFTINEFIHRNVGRRIHRLKTAGREHRFQVTSEHIPVLAEFVRMLWIDWRAGVHTTRVAAKRLYFVSPRSWNQLPTEAQQVLIPTGVSWLEGYGNEMPRVSKRGVVARLQFLVKASDWHRHVLQSTESRIREQRENEYDSEACVLADDHPIWTIMEHRRAGDFDPAWPSGLRALDAVDDPEPRVRDAARELWDDWVRLHQTHVRMMLTRNA